MSPELRKALRRFAKRYPLSHWEDVIQGELARSVYVDRKRKALGSVVVTNQSPKGRG